MSLIVSEVYDALLEAGASEAKAKAAAGAIPLAEQLATKEDVAGLAVIEAEQSVIKQDIAVLKEDVAGLKEDVAAFRVDLNGVKANLNEVDTALRAEMNGVEARLRAEIAGLGSQLYRHLWVMGMSIVGLTVTLTVTLVKLLG